MMSVLTTASGVLSGAANLLDYEAYLHRFALYMRVDSDSQEGVSEVVRQPDERESRLVSAFERSYGFARFCAEFSIFNLAFFSPTLSSLLVAFHFSQP